MTEHPVQQAIRAICVVASTENSGGEEYIVGGGRGVTQIEACTKSGMHSDIPYVRVWEGETCLAEFCQHNIVGVYFEDVSATPSTTAVIASCGHEPGSFECEICAPF